jgi:hypothetical protein
MAPIDMPWKDVELKKMQYRWSFPCLKSPTQSMYHWTVEIPRCDTVEESTISGLQVTKNLQVPVQYTMKSELLVYSPPVSWNPGVFITRALLWTAGNHVTNF